MKPYFNRKPLILSAVLVALCLALAASFSSCGPEDCRKDGTCPPPEFYRFTLGEAKPYVWALPGSYWIYKNTSTGDLDTVTCLRFKFDSLTVKGTRVGNIEVTITYDKIQRQLYSSFFKWYIDDENLDQTPYGKYYKNHREVLTRLIGGQGYICAFHTPFTIGAASGTGSETTTYIGMDTTLQIQGKTYNRVAKFDISMDETWEDTPPYTEATYYWAKEVGLIKRTSPRKNYSWELIEYQIIQ